MIGCDLHSKLATLKINFVTNMCMEFPFRYYALSKAISSKLSSYVDRRDKIDHPMELNGVENLWYLTLRVINTSRNVTVKIL